VVALRNVLTMPDERVYTIDEIAEWLGFHRNTVRKWIVKGDLVAHQFGKEYRIKQSDIDDFMRRRQLKPRKAEDQD
jgi:excisionase family DNA binding protein